MTCPICHRSWNHGVAPRCPQCGFLSDGKEAALDLDQILMMRTKFHQDLLSSDPGKLVSLRDKWRPWLGTTLGFLLFMLWLRACSSGGWHLW